MGEEKEGDRDMSDYINRQAAIRALDVVPYDEDMWSDEYSNGYYFRAKKDKAAIESVPSADVEPVVRCRDCKHYQFADNRAFAKKFILDGMVKSGLIENDNWSHVTGFTDRFALAGANRVEVTITEVEDDL